ncbi:MAG TPA: ATP-binding protein [Pirellulales bacterium]|nr:ATP-binding protein [Pirellulales bacterium]
MPSLFVFRGNNQGMRFELEADVLSLGREAGNDVQLHDTEVSRRHAELRRSDKTFTLTDQGSSNGTYVNGQRIQSHQLVNGDEVQMGGTVMLYTCLGDESTGDLADKIDIIARRPSGDQSRIVRSMSQAEGSRILSDDSAVAASPWLARARSNLQVMYRTALAVSHTLDIDQLLNRIMQLIFEWVEADRGCIMLVNPDTGKLEPKVRRNRKGVKSGDRITISKTILDYVMEHNEGVLTSDASEDDRWNPAASILQMGICEAICAPMQGRYNMVGVIYIDTSTSPQRLIQQQSAKFTEEHLKLMIAIAHQAALAVEDTRYYSAMVQAERLAAVGQTIATLSHHIKNILQGIRGGSFLIKEGLSQHDEAMVGKGWEFVEKNQERISNLVMDMLTFSKDREPELAPSDLNEVAADVVELMTSRAKEKQVELQFTPATGLPLLTFDPDGLHRAILNVATNAIDACDRNLADDDEAEDEAQASPKAPGKVDVSVEFDPAAAVARVIVADNGSGIPAEQLDKIFTLFVSHKGSRGTGLGLAVSQKIMQEHGGRIHVESQPGEGSRFTLEFPAIAPDAPASNPKLDGRTLV